MSHNLYSMRQSTLKKIESNQRRQAIIDAWRNRPAGTTQSKFCTEHGIGSTRTLRNILYHYSVPEVPLERARAILERTIKQLSTILDSISELPGGSSLAKFENASTNSLKQSPRSTANAAGEEQDLPARNEFIKAECDLPGGNAGGKSDEVPTNSVQGSPPGGKPIQEIPPEDTPKPFVWDVFACRL